MRQQLSSRISCALVLLATIVSGCEKRRETVDVTFGDDDCRYILAVVIDMSGSFADRMADNGEAYAFLGALLDRYTRAKVGSGDRLVIAQVSGSDNFLLWEGRPLDLRREFDSAGQFRDFLCDNASSSSSQIYEGMVNVLKYVMANPGVTEGRVKPVIFFLSDMEDTEPGKAARGREIRALLKDYGSCGGSMGLYYVETWRVGPWQRELSNAGIQQHHVQADIVGKPDLPEFD
ncbi:MAG: hypothetical protein DWQ37_20155 [Planctomycetota bacterium]|nr:MAG: hypothetical protein DWQ37_20155 [Planctomycetota bacterium]